MSARFHLARPARRRLRPGAALGMACALAATFVGYRSNAQDFAVTGATLVLGDGSDPIENGTVVVQGGRVTAAGAGVPIPAGVETLDGSGSWVTPGLFSAVTDLGLWDVEAVDESNDVEADESPFSAALDVVPAINPSSQHIAVSRAGGVTRATVTALPAGSIFAGQGAVIDLGADPQAIIRPRAFQLVVLGEQGGRIAGGSRIAAHTLFRNALREALDIGQPGDDEAPITTGGVRAPEVDTGDDIPVDPQLAGREVERGSDVLLTRFDAAALVPVVTGRQKLYVAVDRAADILAVLALRQEFPRLDMVLVGAAEGWLVADQIAAAGVPVLAEALVDLPESFEIVAATQSNVGRMMAAGVKVALGGFIGTDRQPRWATQHAGNLVALGKLPGAAGLTWAQAFAAISSLPAEISGYGGRAGVLAPGAVGDLVVWDGDPLEVSSNTVRVFIDGVEQPLANHQTRLRDRYRDLDESDLPKAYDW